MKVYNSFARSTHDGVVLDVVIESIICKMTALVIFLCLHPLLIQVVFPGVLIRV